MTQDRCRITEKKIDINYNNTLNFFKNRANKYVKNNPYAVTMYQDKNPQIVEKRNKAEIDKLLPLLNLDHESIVLDIACGIGRWSDAIKCNIKSYYGIDFSEDLIDIARRRVVSYNRKFYVGKALDIEKVKKENNISNVNRVLLIGILMYLNDIDLSELAHQILNVICYKSIICIREPIGIKNRLTLNNFYSEELNDNYNAIYRTREEIKSIFIDIFEKNGFTILEEGNVFEDGFNNRKETNQYYFILERT